MLDQSPWKAFSFPRRLSSPALEASMSSPNSLATLFKLVRTASMVLLIKTFLPGNFSNSASKFPLPNSATHAMAFFFTAICPKTIPLTPSPISLKAPWNFVLSTFTSISPKSCWVDMFFISATNLFSTSTMVLRAFIN